MTDILQNSGIACSTAGIGAGGSGRRAVDCGRQLIAELAQVVTLLSPAGGGLAGGDFT